MRRYIPNPKEGDKRTRLKFAWEKVIATDGEGRSAEIWFEWYEVTEEFHKHKKEVVEEWAVIERKIVDKKVNKKGLKSPSQC